MTAYDATPVSPPLAETAEAEFQYRPLSTAAIASVVFGLVSSLTFLAGNVSLQACLMLCPIPVIGLFCGITALSKIREMPNQLSGLQAAVAGTVMSALGLVGGVSYAGYVHATEVPPGYARLSFYDLRPDEVEQRGSQLVPNEILELDGKSIFVKGYMRPGAHYSASGSPVSRNVSKFMLVRDSNECCFGDISTVKYYDKMQIELKQGLLTNYSSGIFRVAGKLKIAPPEQGRPDPVYWLQADYLQ